MFGEGQKINDTFFSRFFFLVLTVHCATAREVRSVFTVVFTVVSSRYTEGLFGAANMT